ncbi:MAG: hypothetical protein JST26_03535 [Bacteroidetes bacterium]|nr:hypothetical protein [Bacteroidota bacterium]
MNLITNKDLFDLVKSLSKSEKRFLKLNAAATNQQKVLIQFFDELEKEKEYNEELFIKPHKSKHGLFQAQSQLSESLYDLILQCLRGFYAESSASFTIKDEITDILNLFDKAQYKQCRKVLNKLKQEAYKYERFHFILEIISLEKMLIAVENQFGIVHTTIERLITEEKALIQKAKNLGDYTILFSKINMMTRQSSKAKNKTDVIALDDLLNSPLLKDEGLAQSKRAQVIYHDCRSALFAKKQENEKRRKECEALIRIMDKHPELMEEMPKRYLSAINNLIAISYENRHFKACHEYIKLLRDKAELKAFNTTDLQLKIFTSTYNAELITYTDSGKYENALQAINNIEEGLARFKGKINKEEVLIFYYNIALLHAYAGEYSKALDYINLILSQGDKLLRQDLQCFARIINIGLHYELGRLKPLRYIISSVKEYYKTQPSLFKTEMLILSYFEKLAAEGVTAKQDEIAFFKSFYKDLKEVMKDKHEQSVKLYFDIETYTESKLTGKSINTLLNEKYEKAWVN